MHSGTARFRLPSVRLLASLGLEPLRDPRISPAAQTLGPKAPGGSPPTLGVQIRGAYLGLGLGLVETSDTVTAMDALCQVHSWHRSAACPHSLSPGPQTPLGPRNAPFSPASLLGREVLAKLSAALW